jgi:hypothetical protein
VIYGRLEVITRSDKQTETKFGQQDRCCKASAYPYRSMLKTWLVNKMESSRIWEGRQGRRERVVATSWRPGNGRREILPSIFPLRKVEYIGRPRGEIHPFLDQLLRVVVVCSRCLIRSHSTMGIFKYVSVAKLRVNTNLRGGYQV